MSTPKNILYVSPNAHLGGAERGVELMLTNHDKKKYQSSIIFLRDGPLVEQFKNLAVDVAVMPKVRMREVWKHHSLVNNIAQFIREKKIDLVHSVMSYGHYFGGRAARHAGVHSVWYQHGPVAPRDRWISLIPTDVILVNSHYTKEEQKKIMLRKFPIEIATPGGVNFNHDQQAVRKKGAALRASLGLRPGDFVVGSLGRIDSWKGQLQLVNALEVAIKLCPKIRGLIIGNADLGNLGYQQEIKNYIQEHKLKGQVIMPGFIDDFESAHGSLDLFVHSSIIPEPFGLVIVEAMAYGHPVIAAPAGGVPEIVQDRVNGLLVNPLDTEALARAIVELAENKILRDQLTAKALEDARRKYTPETFTRQVERVYDKILL